jgi:chemotaxis protein histidine kinase CheA
VGLLFNMMETRNRRGQQEAEPEQLEDRQQQQPDDQAVLPSKEPSGVAEMLRQLSQQMQQQQAATSQQLQQQQESLTQQIAASQQQQAVTSQQMQQQQAATSQQMQQQQESLTQQIAASQQQQQQLQREAQESLTQQIAASQQRQLAAQEEQTKQLRTQVAATLAEHSERLESRLVGQLQQETEKIRSAFQKEVAAVSERVEAVERGQNLQHQQLASQQQRLDRLDSTVGEHTSRHQEVGEKLIALTGRVDAVQREFYQRLSAAEGVRVAESLSGTGSSRPLSPSVEGGSVKIKTRPAPFDGRTSWLGYKAQFDLIADLNGWSLADRAQHLAAALAGPALIILANLSASERLSYTHLTEALNTRFNEGRSAELARIRLDNRKQLPNEKLALYASEVENLTQLAYPTAGGEARDVLTRERFLKGLHSSELRKQIKLSRAVTFSEMLGTAIELEAVLLSEADSADHVIARRSAVRLIHEEGGSPRKRARGACFGCGSLSHHVAYCDAAPVDCDRSPPLTSNLTANSRRNFQAANVPTRVRHASDSRGGNVRLESGESGERTQNLSGDVLGAIERLGRRVDALAADRRPLDASGGRGGVALTVDRHQRVVSNSYSDGALAAERPQREVSGNVRRSGSVPRGGNTRRGECYECGSATHYRNRCPLIQNAQNLN